MTTVQQLDNYVIVLIKIILQLLVFKKYHLKI